MRLFVFIALFLFFSSSLYGAERYFAISLDNQVVGVEGEIVVEMRFDIGDIDLSRFSVRPIFSGGNVHIYDEEKEDWIFGNGLWSNLPSLNDEISVKVGADGELHFLIQDKITSKIYETNKKRVLSRNWFVKYVGDLNKNVLGW